MNPYTIEFLLLTVIFFTITKVKNWYKVTEGLIEG
jgi:hypothetical protein